MKPLLDQLFVTIILGLVQGVSEWLPISSTAHLKIAGEFLGLTVTPLFNLVLHLGTLFVLVFFFRSEIKGLLVALMHLDFRSESGMLLPRIVVATVPTAVISVLYTLFLQNSFQSFLIIGITFLVGATFVFSTRYAKEDQNSFPYTLVLLMGVAQGFAIFPGLSRSGITISVALLFGLKREKAFKFSFLLSIPAVLGDFVFEAYTQMDSLSALGFSVVDIILGFVVAAVVGYFALRLLSRVVRGKKFYMFAFYTWAVGVALLVWTLLVH